VIDAAGPPDAERVERARSEVIDFFRGLEERLERLERKVDLANRMLDTLGRGLLGRKPLSAKLALVPIDPAFAKKVGAGWEKLVEAWKVFTTPGR